MIFKVLTAAALGLAMTLPAHAGTDLVQNGNFESTTNGLGQFDYETSAVGWSSAGYNFIFGAGTGDTSGSTGQYGGLSLWGTHNSGSGVLTNSPTGGNFVAADGAFIVAPIQQTITGLTPGKSFIVAFDWAAAQQTGYNGATTEQWKVSLGMQSLSTSIYDNPSHGFSGWMHERFVFAASSSTEVLSFLAAGTPAGEPPFSLLDGVSGSTVPESAIWAMMVLGFGLVGSAVRRRSGAVVA